jgi:hypothetical protein
MATTYFWTINEMLTYPTYEGYENYINQIKWKYSAINEEGIIVYLFGQTNFNNLTENYTPYSEITEEEVIGWLNSDPEIQYYRDNLDRQMLEKLYPLIQTLPLPWEENPS